MAEISRFYGIIVRIFTETGEQHHAAHIHVYYQNMKAVYDINSIELLTGALPRRQQRLVEAWIELYQEELLENWKLAFAGERVNKIPPLRR
jgi:hypothetical protein